MLEFGSAGAISGSKETGVLDAGELRDGTKFGLPVAVVNGSADGPTLYLQAASDGNELNGLSVVREVYSRVDPKELSGNILFVGILNFHGYQVAEHKNPIDDTKLNRVFPGSAKGSSSERLAHLVYNEGVKRSDLGIDLHQGSTSRMIDEVRVRCGTSHRLYEDCLALAKSFGMKYILDKKGPDGQLARAAPDDGVPFIDPELGGSVGWDTASIRKGVSGVFNVLQSYDFLEGEPSLPEAYTRASSFDSVHANRGGILDYHVDLYDEVEENQPLFDVTTIFGKHKETVRSGENGIVWRTRRLPMVATGEYVLSIATGVESI